MDLQFIEYHVKILTISYMEKILALEKYMQNKARAYILPINTL